MFVCYEKSCHLDLRKSDVENNFLDFFCTVRKYVLRFFEQCKKKKKKESTNTTPDALRRPEPIVARSQSLHVDPCALNGSGCTCVWSCVF